MTLSTSTGRVDDPDAQPARVDGSTTPADHFELYGLDYRCSASGAVASFNDPARAAESLASGEHSAIVGALAFDTEAPSALTAPAHIRFDVPTSSRAAAVANIPVPNIPVPNAVGSTNAPGPVAEARVVAAEPLREEHRDRVAAAVAVLADSTNPLAKVVLARKLLLDTSPRLTPESFMAALAALNPHSGIFRTELTPAGDAHHGRHLVGASPEVLIRRRGRQVSAHPLAGSTPRHHDPIVDAERAATLNSSAKDLGEHRFVVDALRSALAPLCTRLDVPDAPSIVGTSSMWHLGTPIVGELADPSTTALDLAIAVHPTPAVCGTPTAAAREYILATEGDRGFYGGAVGWCVGNLSTDERSGALRGADGITPGDGEWLVAIRCAEIDSRTGTLATWAGGGIVADSDPDAEVAETTAKLRTVLRALGADEI
ncbi:chorismate-binding protein [Gordonia sp. w5E2]|uniref:Isochorismate synthase n=1 Tax=Gordonia jacobaea TaxID=122202 RepID=A0ABR5II61_9ACTN|nr:MULTISPECIES: chorismate-binding protein [Gordonia]KNA93260.1 isochorismate synthase [Gordonia jacobaea]